MIYYTIFLKGKLFIQCTDDMNTSVQWSRSGKIWKNKKDAVASLEDIRSYYTEPEKSDFRIVEFEIT